MRISAAPVLGMTLALSIGLLAAACGTGHSARPTGTPPVSSTAPRTATPTTSSTPAASFEKEVEVTYLAYWDAYSAAVLNLDVTRVEGFAEGEELARIRDEVETLKANGVALRVVVEHALLVVRTSASEATVVDEVVNRSFYVDPVTKQPPTATGSGEVLRNTFFLRKVDGRWVVIRGLRART